MKNLSRLFLISAMMWVSGCGPLPGGGALNGVWRGTVTEKGKTVSVELEIFEQRGMLKGGFKIASETGSNDFTKGMAFEIVQAEHVGNHFKFIVPFSGEVDNDSVVFDLTIEGNKLTGFGKERHPRSEKIPVVFTKHRK